MKGNELYLQGLTEGQIIKLRRVALGLRQIDLASKAHCEVMHITSAEKGRWVRPDIHERILVTLGLWEGVDDE